MKLPKRKYIAAGKHVLKPDPGHQPHLNIIFFRILCNYPGIFDSKLIFSNKTKYFDKITYY